LSLSRTRARIVGVGDVVVVALGEEGEVGCFKR
jgi:hypothetical protein